MEALAWIITREPQPPPALVARITRALNESAPPRNSSIASQLLVAAVALLSRTDRSRATEASTTEQPPSSMTLRSGALDLLAADALVTYAMESACDACESIDIVADSAIRTICDLR